MRLSRFSLFVACLLLAGASAARAEGPGVELGSRLVLHPGIAVETRFDSNVFFQSNSPAWAFILRVMPTIDLATRPPQRELGYSHVLDFRLHAGLDYEEFLSSSSLLREHRAFGVQAGALATLFPAGQLTLDIYDNYVRTTQPPYSPEPYNLDRDANEAGLRGRYRPGGGRLELDLGYAFGLDFFERSPLDDFNLIYNHLSLRGSWKFLPKTAVYVQVDETPYHYLHPGVFMHPDSYPLRAVAGLVGLITYKLTVDGWVGYGNGFYTTGPNPSSPIGGVSLTWRPTLLSTGSVGYTHNFVNSLLGDYYDLDEPYLTWTQLIWRFTASAKLAYQYIQFHGILPIAGIMPLTGNETDNYVALDLRLDYPFKDWLIASAGYDLQYNTSDSALSNGPSGLIPINYTKHEGWLRLSVLY